MRKVTFYGNTAAAPWVVAAINARLLFRDDLYPSDTGTPFPQLYRAMTRSMASALKAVDPADLNSDTIAVMHTTTVFQLGALTEWYESLAARQRPKLFVQFQHPIEFMVEPRAEWPGAIGLAKAAVDALTAAGSVRFAANSKPLANRISSQLDRPCALMPVPVRWPDRARVGAPERSVMFGFFGGLRREKGAELLAPAIASLAARYPDARFIVHAPRGQADPAIVRSLEALPQVELIRRSFTHKAHYFACLKRARWILLPYDPEPYALRTSGVFLEALGLGVPVVVTAGTWMAGELQSRDARGLTMADYSASALFDCLVEARHSMLAADDAPPMLDRDVIAEHSAAHFCSAMLHLMQA
jgi:glycosyltransferase involved in cell wall biosynthesis